MTSIEGDAPDVRPEPLHPGPDVNVGPLERGLSVTVGAALLALALSRRRGRGSLALGLLGGYLAWRGATGHCPLYDALDTGSAEDEEDERLDAGGHDDVSVEATATIGRTPEEVYAFVRRMENAPRFLAFVESVEPLDGTRALWRARFPGGGRFTWESEVLEDRPGELLVWRSQPGSAVHQACAVRLRPAPGGGTEVRLDVEFEPPATPLARVVSCLFSDSDRYVVEEDLQRLRQLLESGEIIPLRGLAAGSPDTDAGP
jgi:uncharacterized membrane protein